MRHFILAIILAFGIQVTADDQAPKVLSLEAGLKSPPADLSGLDWLAGHWRGEAFGGIIEEIWAPPLGGNMMGAFKLVAGGKVQFMEIETIIQEKGTLVFRLKHFNADLKGWEEKDDTIDFWLVKKTPEKVFFDGLTIEKLSDEAMNIFVRIENKGQISVEKFHYSRVNR